MVYIRGVFTRIRYTAPGTILKDQPSEPHLGLLLMQIDNICQNEPVAFINTIQSFGALIVVDRQHQIVKAASSKEIGFQPEEILGKQFDQAFPTVNRLGWAALERRAEPTVPILMRSPNDKQWLNCSAHRSGDYSVFEFEMANASQELSVLKFKNDQMDSLIGYLSYIVENLRVLTGYDRVMAYRFANDWHGEVIAEAISPTSQAHSFFGHHFPASDIPEPARRLFEKNWVRMIVNVDEPPVPIQSTSAEIVDLTQSSLRSPSPIHVDYLRIMGVKASLTLSLICDGKLWGLIACHHLSPKFIEANQRSVLGLSAKLISSRISTLSIKESFAATEKSAAFLKKFSDALTLQQSNLIETVRDYKVDLYEMIKSDGFAFLDGLEIVFGGHMPSLDNLHRIRHVLENTGKSIIVTSKISELSSSLSDLSALAAGILAIKVANEWFVWTRSEASVTRTWAGNPESKNLYIDNGEQRMSPRLSFESWIEESRGQSRDWQQSEIDAAQQLQLSVLELQGHFEKLRSENAYSYLNALKKSILVQATDLRKHLSTADFDRVVKDDATVGN